MSKGIAVLALISVGASLGCMHLVRELRAERVQVQTLQSRVTELEQAVAAHKANASTAPSSPTPVSPWSAPVVEHPAQAPARESSASARSAAPPPAVPDQIRAHMQRQRDLLKDPKYREAMRVQQRLHMDSSYPGLTEALGFTNEEAERFFDLLSQHQLADMEQAQETMPWGPQDPESARIAHEAMLERQQRNQVEMDAQFGPNTHQKWKEYQETLGPRHRVASMQAQLAIAGAPLSAEQSKMLLNAFVEEQRRQSSEMVAAHRAGGTNAFVAGMQDPEAYAKTQERAHERIVSSVESSLSPQQVSHVESMLKRERESQRASMELVRAQGLGNEQGVIMGNWSSAPMGFVTHAAPVELENDAQEQP